MANRVSMNRECREPVPVLNDRFGHRTDSVRPFGDSAHEYASASIEWKERNGLAEGALLR